MVQSLLFRLFPYLSVQLPIADQRKLYIRFPAQERGRLEYHLDPVQRNIRAKK